MKDEEDEEEEEEEEEEETSCSARRHLRATSRASASCPASFFSPLLGSRLYTGSEQQPRKIERQISPSIHPPHRSPGITYCRAYLMLTYELSKSAIALVRRSALQFHPDEFL